MKKKTDKSTKVIPEVKNIHSVAHVFVEKGDHSSYVIFDDCEPDSDCVDHSNGVLSFTLRTDVGYREEMSLISMYIDHVNGTAYEEESIHVPLYWRLYDAKMALDKAVLVMLTDIDVDKVDYDLLCRYGVLDHVYARVDRDILGNVKKAFDFVYNDNRAILEISNDVKSALDFLTKNVSDEKFDELSKQLSGLKEINLDKGVVTKKDIEKILPSKVKKRKMN